MVACVVIVGGVVCVFVVGVLAIEYVVEVLVVFISLASVLVVWASSSSALLVTIDVCMSAEQLDSDCELSSLLLNTAFAASVQVGGDIGLHIVCTLIRMSACVFLTLALFLRKSRASNIVSWLII